MEITNTKKLSHHLYFLCLYYTKPLNCHQHLFRGPSCCILRVDKQLSGEINACYYSYQWS